MIRLHNPTATRLFCVRLERFLAPGEHIAISEEEAAELKDGAVFIVEQEPAAGPVRETVTRGAKQAEVTRAPKREKRG